MKKILFSAIFGFGLVMNAVADPIFNEGNIMSVNADRLYGENIGIFKDIFNDPENRSTLQMILGEMEEFAKNNKKNEDTDDNQRIVDDVDIWSVRKPGEPYFLEYLRKQVNMYLESNEKFTNDIKNKILHYSNIGFKYTKKADGVKIFAVRLLLEGYGAIYIKVDSTDCSLVDIRVF